MFGNMFANMPDVVKNLVILNALFFLATIVFQGQNIYLDDYLGLHYPSSEKFAPYQYATHFFMHGGILHIFFNMFGLVVLGSHLERLWGPKRFILFYFSTAIGAAILYQVVQGIQIYQICGEVFPDFEIVQWVETSPGWGYFITDPVGYSNVAMFHEIGVVGASGAVYGLIAAFALLFPNTQFMLLFPPIPIKAKWLALILLGAALYLGFKNNSGDNVAHFAHLGGMLFAFIFIKIWQKDRSNFF